jgi:pyrrolidone-carboxylate peptidase
MTVEEARLDQATAALGHMTAAEFSTEKEAVYAGSALWQMACSNVASGKLDDRPLYWQRLATLRQCRNSVDEAALQGFESASRGLDDFKFSEKSDLRIAVTGFDPFGLEAEITQGNPSGVIALAINGRQLKVGRQVAEIRSAMVPVRFSDFDNGFVEGLLVPVLNDLDMIFTVSMGRDGFDLERFPGKRRASGKPDNLDLLCGGTPVNPIVPPGLTGPDFVEFSLPVDAMRSVTGEFEIRDNRTVTTLESGQLDAGSLDEIEDQTAVQGSGGSYLSNEISYRAVRLVNASNRFIPVGHIHTPRMAGFDSERVPGIVEQAITMIEAAVKTLESS